MENYVRDRFYNKSEKFREGFDYLDFCYKVLEKIISGVRNWDKNTSTFEECVFGSLRSDLYNYFRKQKNKYKQTSYDKDSDTHEVHIIEINTFVDINEVSSYDINPDLDYSEISEDLLQTLKEDGADKLEIDIFECWLTGYYRPKEISELCEVTMKEFHNAVKRLSRKKIKLQEKWMSLKKI